MEKMSRALERAKMLVGMEVDEEVPTEDRSFVDEFNQHCTLSTKQRLYGFTICLGSGLACTFLSTLVFFNPIKFGITFTFGNLLALGRETAALGPQSLMAAVLRSVLVPVSVDTVFLIGPKRQFDMMLDPVRIYATAIYISSLILALLCAFYVHNKILTLLAIMLEFGALVWYGLSYIPFARSMVSKIFNTCMDTEF